MTTISCRSCGARIGFIDLPSGKKMPVDPELVKTFVVLAPPPGARRLILVTDKGEMARGFEVSLTHPSAEPLEGFVPHYRSCTDPRSG